jgi:Tfp pilus assembly protein PilV
MVALRTKIQAATLIEVIVSLVIIMIFFGIAMMIYINVLNTSISNRQIQADLLLKEVCEETILNRRYFDEKIEKDGFVVYKSIRKYSDMENVIHLHVETLNKSKVVSRDQLINAERDEED